MANVGSFTIAEDFTAEVLAAKERAVLRALKMIGVQAERNAKLEVTKAVYEQPISKSGYKRTGRLRNGITHETDADTVYVGDNVDYAIYVELGTSKMKERPFIRPAIENHLEEYEKMFRQCLENA